MLASFCSNCFTGSCFKDASEKSHRQISSQDIEWGKLMSGDSSNKRFSLTLPISLSNTSNTIKLDPKKHFVYLETLTKQPKSKDKSRFSHHGADNNSFKSANFWSFSMNQDFDKDELISSEENLPLFLNDIQNWAKVFEIFEINLNQNDDKEMQAA